MAYPMMKSPSDWIPAERHNRSQNAGVAYTLVDLAMTAVDAFMRISSLVVLNFSVWVCRVNSTRRSRSDQNRSVEVKQLDEGIGNTLV